jgi:ketosteroid isomerase-like protein
VAPPISPDEVRALVHRLWSIRSGKSSDSLEDLYSPSAVMFTGNTKRSEGGRLSAVRRMRKLRGPGFAAGAKIDPIEVHLAGPDVAIASDTYRFHSHRTRKDGSREQRDTLFGRSTQMFQRGVRGDLRIVHEHLSSAEPVSPEEVRDA